MGFWELTLLAIGLSMDAFAVSICKGLAMDPGHPGKRWGGGAVVWRLPGADAFGGVVFGLSFLCLHHRCGPWIAFVLLVVLG